MTKPATYKIMRFCALCRMPYSVEVRDATIMIYCEECKEEHEARPE